MLKEVRRARRGRVIGLPSSSMRPKPRRIILNEVPKCIREKDSKKGGN